MTDSITLASERLTATFSCHGARLETLRLDGGPSLVLHAPHDRHPDWRAMYPGAIVGPIANRIDTGTLAVAGRTCRMPCNENGVTALHSGPDGLDQQVWDVTRQSGDQVHLRCTLADGHGGLPGQRLFSVCYAITDTTLSLNVTATTDAPTPINIAHHPYWRLGDAADHLLTVQADHYLPVDARNIPTGAVAQVAGTAFDFRSPRPLPDWIDHNLCLSDRPCDAPRPIATLTGTDGLRMRIDSTEAGLQVYAGTFLPTVPGTAIAPLAGIALEPQGWPDAPNAPDFPQILVTPTETYRQITTYSFDYAT